MPLTFHCHGKNKNKKEKFICLYDLCATKPLNGRRIPFWASSRKIKFWSSSRLQRLYSKNKYLFLSLKTNYSSITGALVLFSSWKGKKKCKIEGRPSCQWKHSLQKRYIVYPMRTLVSWVCFLVGSWWPVTIHLGNTLLFLDAINYLKNYDDFFHYREEIQCHLTITNVSLLFYGN